MDEISPAPGSRRFPRLPLYARVLIGVALGLGLKAALQYLIRVQVDAS
jgi:hypothetical protein